MATHDHFPMFIDTKGKKVVVVGGGKIAERRIHTLVHFSFDVTVRSEDITQEIQQLVDAGTIHYEQGSFDPEKPEQYADLFFDAYMVLACTDDRTVNQQIGRICKEHDILVNVCDAQDESTFWFPAIALNDELTMGLVGNGKSHETVRKAASQLRHIIEKRLYKA